MSNCIICSKYSYGNKYCYSCYNELINETISKKDNSPNQCIKCKKNIQHIGYCQDCYQKNFPLTPEEIAFKYYNTYYLKSKYAYRNKTQKPKIENPSENKKKQKIKKEENNIVKTLNSFFNKEVQPEVNNCLEHKIISKKENITLCKICNLNSHGKTYCYGCYQKIQKGYKTPPKDYDNQKYKCDCGIFVRSQGERTISDFLYKNKIYHEYEKKIVYNEFDLTKNTVRRKSIKPDFYIQGPVNFKNKIIENVYIEFFGITGIKEYEESNLYKEKVYKDLQTTVIIIYPDDIENYKESLTYKLTNFNYNQINYLKEG